MAALFRDARGVEYESVPLPTHEVTDAVPLAARIVSKRTPTRTIPVYGGTDGAELAHQPRGHRRHWNDAQWIAFKEHQQLEVELLQHDEPVATAMVIKKKNATGG